MKIVTVEQMRWLENASGSEGVSADTLMENAGLAVAIEARKVLGTVASSRVLILVGSGNNGGDGLVAGRHLKRWGAEVIVYLALPRQEEGRQLRLAVAQGVLAILASGDRDTEALERELSRSRLIIDAVLGTGRARPLEGTIREVMLRLGAARAHRRDLTVMALDLPTGMDADTGRIDPACPAADITVTFGYPKQGHFQFPGTSKLGRLEVVDIGIPDHLAKNVKLELLTNGWVKDRLPTRPLNAHKGTFGHTLVIAGSRSYVGAAYLAAQGAARVGPGLVTLASPCGVYPILASKLTEVIHLPLPEDEHGRFSVNGVELIKEGLDQFSSLLVGCGFGMSDGLVEFLKTLLLTEPTPRQPVVVDADGLNNLSKIDSWWAKLKCPAVLTPHPGEMSTLTDIATSDIQERRSDAALKWSARWGTVVALKGAHTAIATPEGMCRVSPFANPALSSGGTGDVLTGIISGLLAQGLSPEDASSCGVYIHGLAGEMVGKELGDTGTLAGDLLPALPRAIRLIRGS